jgi:hypothetical protein
VHAVADLPGHLPRSVSPENGESTHTHLIAELLVLVHKRVASRSISLQLLHDPIEDIHRFGSHGRRVSESWLFAHGL